MKLTIPTPCSENWDAMTPTACGRFCAVCQKEVIDVTQMDDSTILQKYSDNGGELCIRARAEQISPTLTVRTFPMQRLAVFALAVWLVFAGGLVSEVQGQADSMRIARQATNTVPEETTVLIVLVLSEDNQPIVGAQVRTFDPRMSKLTDQNGYVIFDEMPANTTILFVIKDSLFTEIDNLTLSKDNIVNEITVRMIPRIKFEQSPRQLNVVQHIGGRMIPEIRYEAWDDSKLPNRVFDTEGNVFLNQYKIGR